MLDGSHGSGTFLQHPAQRECSNEYRASWQNTRHDPRQPRRHQPAARESRQTLALSTLARGETVPVVCRPHVLQSWRADGQHRAGPRALQDPNDHSHPPESSQCLRPVTSLQSLAAAPEGIATAHSTAAGSAARARPIPAYSATATASDHSVNVHAAVPEVASDAGGWSGPITAAARYGSAERWQKTHAVH